MIYAQNNDLVVLAPVNAGAQVIADGHVHIYAKLRGRAVAGAKGLPGARIFVQKLEAELVAVSGAYMMRRGDPARASRQVRRRSSWRTASAGGAAVTQSEIATAKNLAAATERPFE